MAGTTTTRQARPDRRLMIGILAGGIVLVVLTVMIAAGVAERDGAAPFDTSLPNPMGGPAMEAPGPASGRLALGGLVVDGVEVAMGDVALGVTYVPAWHVTNPTDAAIALEVGQPQVLEGCCPGPVYADGALTHAGQDLMVPAGGSVHLQFPLQMHPGMDGQHHLALPLRAAGATDALHVTGNFIP